MRTLAVIAVGVHIIMNYCFSLMKRALGVFASYIFFNVLAQNQVRGNLKIANMTNMGMASVTKLNLSLITIMDSKRGCTGVRKQFVFIAQ